MCNLKCINAFFLLKKNRDSLITMNPSHVRSRHEGYPERMKIYVEERRAKTVHCIFAY